MKKHIKKTIRLFLTGVLAFGLFNIAYSQTTNTKQTPQIDNYKTRYTPEGRKQTGKRGTYTKDIHVWVYTSEFAKRFGMPEEWINDDLKGAEALAYRLDLDVYGTKCGYFFDVENCRPSTACVLDMYIDDKANLPWNSKTRFDTYYGRKSKEFLWSQNKNDKPEYLKYRAKRGQQYKLGLDVVTVAYGKNNKSRAGGYFILEYDRDIYKNLDYLSGSVVCRSFGETRDTTLNIYDAIFRKNGSISAKSLNNLTHQIKIPDSFMQKIEAYDKAQYEPNSLFKALRERLSTTTKKPNK